MSFEYCAPKSMTKTVSLGLGFFAFCLMDFDLMEVVFVGFNFVNLYVVLVLALCGAGISWVKKGFAYTNYFRLC